MLIRVPTEQRIIKKQNCVVMTIFVVITKIPEFAIKEKRSAGPDVRRKVCSVIPGIVQTRDVRPDFRISPYLFQSVIFGDAPMER